MVEVGEAVVAMLMVEAVLQENDAAEERVHPVFLHLVSVPGATSVIQRITL